MIGRKMGKMVFSLCLLFTLIFLTILLCWVLSRQADNIEYAIKEFEMKKKKRSVSLKSHSEPKQKQTMQGACNYGIDFLGISTFTNNNYANKRHRLPSHRNQNFSGTLLGQDLLCLDTMDAGVNQSVGIFECHGQGRNQGVTFTTDGMLVSSAKLPLCVAMKNIQSTGVILKKCSSHDDTQIWTKHSTKGLLMPRIRKDYCLTAPPDEGMHVTLRQCKLTLPNQKWRLVMNEVMLLWVDGAPTDLKTNKIKKSVRKHMNKLILQSNSVDTMEIDPYILTNDG